MPIVLSFSLVVCAVRLVTLCATAVYALLALAIRLVALCATAVYALLALAIRLVALYPVILNDIRLATLFAIAVLVFHVRSAKNVDIISRMPDDILISILERVDILYATRTCVLSKRWSNLHRFLPDVSLNCTLLVGPHHPEKYPFMNYPFVIINSLDGFLRLRSGSKIRSFCLTCCLQQLVTERFEQCIYFLGRLGVEELTLNCCCDMIWTCPKFYFSCQLLSEMPSLKDFKLRFCYLQPSFRIQSNSLQSLLLEYVTLFPGAIECVLFNCLRLDSLKIKNCKCPPKLSICGPDLKLKSVYISCCEGIEEVELYASNLVVFEFFNREVVNFKFNHVPKLEDIYLGSCEKNFVPYICGELATDLPYLKPLNFTSQCEIQERCGHMRINTFSNLRQLHILISYRQKFNLLLLTPLLQSCPLLQYFLLNMFTVEYDGPVEKKHDVVFHSELKIMEISGFHGMESDIEFALCILRSAICLEKMYITRCFKVFERSEWKYYNATRWSEMTHKRIHKQLQEEVVSRTAQVVIQHQNHLEDSI